MDTDANQQSNANTDVAKPAAPQNVGIQNVRSNDIARSEPSLDDTLSALEDEIMKEFDAADDTQEPAAVAEPTEPVTPTEEPKTDETQQVASTDPEPAQEPTTPQEYVPDHTYKAMGETYEFDDDIKAIIKTKADEDKYRTIMSKAKGLDFYEEKHKRLEDVHAKLEAEYNTIANDSQQLAKVVTDFRNGVQSNDLGHQFRALVGAGITEDQILGIAKHVLDVRQLNPNQRRAYDNQYVQQDQLNQYQSQLQMQQSKLTEMETRHAKAQLDTFMSSKADFVSEFESREHMNQGDFLNAFIHFGNNLEKREGREVNMQEAFDKFKSVYQLNGSKPEVKVKPKPPETMPNIEGTGHSPIAKSIESMDDFMKYAEEIAIRK